MARNTLFFLFFVFALAERKNEEQEEKEIPCCRRQKAARDSIVATPREAIVTGSAAALLVYCDRLRAIRGPMLFPLGTSECLIILVVLLIVAGLSYRAGYFRGRR